MITYQPFNQKKSEKSIIIKIFKKINSHWYCDGAVRGHNNLGKGSTATQEVLGPPAGASLEIPVRGRDRREDVGGHGRHR